MMKRRAESVTETFDRRPKCGATLDGQIEFAAQPGGCGVLSAVARPRYEERDGGQYASTSCIGAGMRGGCSTHLHGHARIP